MSDNPSVAVSTSTPLVLQALDAVGNPVAFNSDDVVTIAVETGVVGNASVSISPDGTGGVLLTGGAPDTVIITVTDTVTSTGAVLTGTLTVDVTAATSETSQVASLVLTLGN